MLRRAFVCSLALCLGTASAALAQVKLEYKFKEGEIHAFTSTVKAKQVLTLNGMDIETSSEQVTTGTSRSGKRDAEGDLRIAQKVDAIRFQIEIGGMTIAYDTSDPNSKIELPQLALLADVLKAIVGKELTVVLDAKDKVKDVEGTEKITEATNGLDPMAQELLKDAQLTDRYKREFEKSHGNLPQILVREGEPWEETEVDDIGSGQKLTFRRRYEYLGTVDKDGRKLDKIGITAIDVTYKMDPESKSPLKAVKSDLKIDSSQGHMLFDREAGAMVERSEVSKIKGTIDFKVGDVDVPGKLDLTYETGTAREDKGK